MSESIKELISQVYSELNKVPGKTIMILGIGILIMIILCLNNIILQENKKKEERINKAIMILCLIALITIPILVFLRFYNKEYTLFLLGDNLYSYIGSVILGVFGILILVNISKNTD